MIFFVNFDQLYLSLHLLQSNNTYISRLPRYESNKFQIVIWKKQIDPGILQHKHGTKCKYATSEFGPPLKPVWGTSSQYCSKLTKLLLVCSDNLFSLLQVNPEKKVFSLHPTGDVHCRQGERGSKSIYIINYSRGD